MAKLKTVEVCCIHEMDCENEKEDTLEKDEITDNFYHLLFAQKHLLFTAEQNNLTEFIVHFTSANYKNSVYSPPEERCC